METEADPLAKTWPQPATAAEVHQVFENMKAMLERLERTMIARLIEVEASICSASHTESQETLDRLYDLAKLLESHGVRHDMVEAAARRQATTIAEMYANSEHAHLKTDTADSRHELEIASLNAQLLELTQAVKHATDSSRDRGVIVAREAKNLKWAVALLVPAMTAIFAAVAETLKLLGGR